MTGIRDAEGVPSVALLLDGWIKQSGLSLREVEERSGVPRSTLSRWRTGAVTNPYHEDMLLKVGAALDLSEVRMNRLLRAANCRSLGAIRLAPRPEDEAPLSHWKISTHHNLPAELTSFFGRENEIIELTELLERRDPAMRLLTLVGPGGCGKSRLGLRLASELLGSFPGGVFAVFLAAINDPRLVSQSIAEAIGLRDVNEDALAARLTNWLKSRRALLVLDNLEQITGCGPEIVKLLRAAPGLKVLTTSRAPLNVSGEHLWPVEPLPLPETTSDKRALDANPAIQLFIERARAAGAQLLFGDRHDDTRSVAEICRRLDGLPLAIELAAAGIRGLNPDQLLATAPNGLALAGPAPIDLPARQRTLQATIRWSLDLLPEDARDLLPRLAVFAGGWTEDAAATVCGLYDETSVAPLLARLAEASLIELAPRQADEAATRYRMLETIRDFGLELLAASGAEADLRERHASYYLALAESAPPYVPDAREGGWHERVRADIDNLRAALAWAETRGDMEMLSRLDTALWPYWYENQLIAEGRRWFEPMPKILDDLPVERRASILLGLGRLVSSLGDFDAMERYCRDALRLYVQLDDPRGRALAYEHIGLSYLMRDEHDEVMQAYANELQAWKPTGDPLGEVTALSGLSFVSTIYGDFATAAQYIQQEAALCRDLPEPLVVGRSLRTRGLFALLTGRFADAIALLTEAVAIWRASGSYQLGGTLFYLGTAQCMEGRLDAAVASYSESLDYHEAIADQVHLALLLLGFAAVARRRDNAERAARLCGASQTIRDTHRIALPPPVEQLYQSEVARVREQIDADAFERAFAGGQDMTTPEALAYAREVVPSPEAWARPSPLIPSPKSLGEGI